MEGAVPAVVQQMAPAVSAGGRGAVVPPWFGCSIGQHLQ